MRYPTRTSKLHCMAKVASPSSNIEVTSACIEHGLCYTVTLVAAPRRALSSPVIVCHAQAHEFSSRCLSEQSYISMSVLQIHFHGRRRHGVLCYKPRRAEWDAHTPQHVPCLTQHLAQTSSTDFAFAFKPVCTALDVYLCMRWPLPASELAARSACPQHGQPASVRPRPPSVRRGAGP